MIECASEGPPLSPLCSSDPRMRKKEGKRLDTILAAAMAMAEEKEGEREEGRDAFRETTVSGGCPGSSQKDIIQGKRVGLGLRGLARRGNREVRVK